MKHFQESFWEQESSAEFLFNQGGPYWHLYTPGHYQQTIFTSEEDFIAGMNITARTAFQSPRVGIYVHALMNNHVHFIMEGAEEDCMEFFNRFKTNLHTYFYRRSRVVDLSEFNYSLAAINNLKSMRNEIVYVGRNGYLARKDCCPFTYLWGSGWMYFNSLRDDLIMVPFASLGVKEKREICKSKDIDLPPGTMMFKGMIDCMSYCQIRKGERFFRDTHHYFNLLSKNWEAYSVIAKQIGERQVLTDEELYSAVVAICVKEYNQKSPSILNSAQKVELARKMKMDYNASNRQICNILNIKLANLDMLG